MGIYFSWGWEGHFILCKHIFSFEISIIPLLKLFHLMKLSLRYMIHVVKGHVYSIRKLSPFFQFSHFPRLISYLFLDTLGFTPQKRWLRFCETNWFVFKHFTWTSSNVCVMFCSASGGNISTPTEKKGRPWVGWQIFVVKVCLLFLFLYFDFHVPLYTYVKWVVFIKSHWKEALFNRFV